MTRCSAGFASRVSSVSVVSAPVSGRRTTDFGTGVWHTTHVSIVGDVVAPQYVQSIGYCLMDREADYRTHTVRARDTIIFHLGGASRLEPGTPVRTGLPRRALCVPDA